MIAYEIQLRYVIRDKFSPRENSVGRNFSGIKILLEKKFCRKKNSQIFSWTEFCLGFPVCFLSCLGQIDAYHH